MTKKQISLLISAALCFLLFGGLILAVLFIDVAPIGPEGSSIGLSTLNGAVRDLLPYNETIYKVTEILGYATILIAFVYIGTRNAMLRRTELIHNKKLRRKSAFFERGLFMMFFVFFGAAALYVLFEMVIINYRPIILPGEELEASFPSSHTLLAVAFMGPVIHDIAVKEKSRIAKAILIPTGAVLMASVIVGRLLSGVHWLTDILGGLFIGSALVLTYAFFYDLRYHDK